jgi:Ca2+-binding RTX toxin-like protein
MHAVEHMDGAACWTCGQALSMPPAGHGPQRVVSPFVNNALPNWPAGQPITWANVASSGDIENPFTASLPAAFVGDVRKAFAAWAAVADLTFQEVTDNDSVDIRLGLSEMLPGSAIGLATSSFLFDEPIHSDLQFLSSINFVTTTGLPLPGGSGNPIPFISVALHEIGHALGLGHETFATAIMNPRVDVDITTLQPDDIAGIRARYGVAEGAQLDPGIGTAGDDLLVGESGVGDVLNGLGGVDRAFGLSGDDTALGGDGNDSLVGNAGDDSLNGEAGNDIARGTIGDDIVRGDSGNDTLFGGGDGDSVEGGAGNDVLNGDSGLDTVAGGSGSDTVRGQGGADRLFGGDGDDFVLGNQGADSLFGGGGNDILIGGEGDDVATGGSGGDAFAFQATHGTDTVTDFEDGIDKISLVGVASFDVLTIVDVGSGARISFEDVPTTAINLDGIAAAQLDAGDFFFS